MMFVRVAPWALCKFLVASVLLGTLAGLAGCGSGNAAETATDPVAIKREALGAFMYANSTASVDHWSTWVQVPADYQYLRERLSTLPVDLPDVELGLFRIRYETNNLPQFTLHLKRPGNSKLLVYNHGHGGLPADFEAQSIAFLRLAMIDGHDILISSMPLTGLNAVKAGAQYAIAVRGRSIHAVVAPELLEIPLYQHPLYEAIDDADHYMHYFIDGALIPAEAMAGHLQPVRKTQFTKVQQTPVTGPRYTEINYVGLSGGATVGVTACAVYRFARCILIAGVMPNYLRVTAEKSWGDAEQITRSFYHQFDVQTLMELASNSSNRLVFVYSRHDPCCFSDPQASSFKADFPGYDVRLNELRYHGYVAEDLLTMLRE